MHLPSHPILSCDDAQRLEKSLFGGDEALEWAAMQRAGSAIGAAIAEDYREIGSFPNDATILVVVGKGHNGGDALIACRWLLDHFPSATAEIVFVFGERALRPLAARAWRGLASSRVRIIQPDRLTSAKAALCYSICLDGIFGFQFRAPADQRVAALIAAVNTLPINLRAAVDLPSAGLFQADFTYATGAVKSPALDGPSPGRVRYLDLGFFSNDAVGDSRVLTTELLGPLARLRQPQSDKRTYGHLFVVGGSRGYPGAVLMTVLAALRAGAGLVTGFAPESLVAAYAARVPEAIWVGWPETPVGGLALEGWPLLRERLERATAFVIGPGISRDRETAVLVTEILKSISIPTVLDADALQPEIIASAKGPLIVTPHAGEFSRIAGGASLPEFAERSNCVVVLKGPVTKIATAAKKTASGSERGRPVIYHSFFGSPVLARGGSGDLLAGMIGGLLAQTPQSPALAAARGTVWHGLAAEFLARTHGQVAVTTTQLLDFLPAALRSR